MPQHPTTPLASSQINQHRITIELVEPVGIPAMVKIVWPAKATVVDPRAFPDAARDIAQLFARAHIVLAALKAKP